MNLALRANGLYGIAPCNNQIKNIGVDEDSTHKGMSSKDKITERLCGMESYPLEFPLKHPKVVLRDEIFEKKTSKIVLYPFSIKTLILRRIRKLFKIPYDITTKQYFARRFERGE